MATETDYKSTFDDRVESTDHREFLSGERKLAETYADIVEFVEVHVADASALGAVVAMSGGLDSTLTAALSAEALGSHRVLGLGLPCNRQEGHHMTDARTIAEALGIEYREIDLRPLLDVFEDAVAPEIDPRGARAAIGNVLARLRMSCVYYAANTRSRLVVGTANRSERLLGYFTKHGDGGADLFPLGDLYKTEVRALAGHAGIPRRIVHKQPTAGLWTGQTDRADLGAPYPVVDRLLRRFVDREQSVERAADAVGVDSETAADIASRYRNSTHKRTVVPTPNVIDRGAN